MSVAGRHIDLRGGIAMLLSVYIILVFINNNVSRFGFVFVSVSLVGWTAEIIPFRIVEYFVWKSDLMGQLDDQISNVRLNGSI